MRPLTSIPSVNAFTSEKSFSIEFDIRVIYLLPFGKAQRWCGMLKRHANIGPAAGDGKSFLAPNRLGPTTQILPLFCRFVLISRNPDSTLPPIPVTGHHPPSLTMPI